MKQTMKTNYFVWTTICGYQSTSKNNVLKTQKVYNRPDVAVSFFWFLKKTKKRYSVQRDGWCAVRVVCAKKQKKM